MRLVKETWIAATPQEVFAFHESDGALDKLIPPWQSVRVIESARSLRPGSRVVLEMRLGPLPIHWHALHTEYDPPRMFADEQTRGPFAAWYHRHWFLDDGRGGTLLRDEIDYELPGGFVGRWLLGGWIRRDLERMFEYRHRITKEVVESLAVGASSS